MLIRHMHVHIYACTYIHRMYILGEHAAHPLPPLLRLLTQTHTLKHLVTSHSLMNSPISNCALVENVVSFSEDETIW